MKLLRYIILLLICSYSSLLHSQRFTSFDSVSIAYTDEGTGTPIILIHGFINTSASFNGTALKDALLAQGYRVIAPDLRGNGNSDKPLTEVSYTNDAEIKDLQYLLDHLKLDAVVALGYSRGSIVLARWLTQEKRITQAVLGGMGIDFTNPDWDRRIIFERAFLGLDSLTTMTKGAVNYAKSQEANLTILGWSQRYQPVTSLKELSSIQIPVAVIAGNEDQDNGDPTLLFKALPNSTLTIVIGDHNTTYRNKPFADAVLNVLKK